MYIFKMVIDYNYNKNKGVLSISYTTPSGGKSLVKYNISKFKTYRSDPNGKYKSWDDKPCSEILTNAPSQLDIHRFIRKLPETELKKLTLKTLPQHFAFDIEVECGNEFPDPNEAKYPVLTISIVNPKMDCVVLGTRELSDPENVLQIHYTNYLNKSEFYKNLGLSPKISYISFKNEEEMLEYFLKNIMARSPVLTGWNVLDFDVSYIFNRLKNTYPDISLNRSSITWGMHSIKYMNARGDKKKILIPNHTPIFDMMDIVDHDFVVMPQKENLTLDYIASNSPVHLNKIEYQGDLQALYENDYPTYVFYNAIDSALVQLIDKCFGTLNNFEMQAQYCMCKIEDSMSKIKLTEFLFNNYFQDNNICVVEPPKYDGPQEVLFGAYVREATPGKHKFVCCNDFASLYPSAIITCNISIENYLGNFSKGDFSIDEIESFKKDPAYFVSVNNSVYKNDHDYSFKIIERSLKSERGKSKYLSKELDAYVVSDIEHILSNNVKKINTKCEYKDNIKETLRDLGYGCIKSPSDLVNLEKNALEKLKVAIQIEIRYLSALEQAIKQLMNSMYGGSSNKFFMFYNMQLANDITGEARNLIHMMEDHIPALFRDSWLNMKDLHSVLGITLKDDYQINDKEYVKLLYGDTDSLYISYSALIDSICGSDEWSQEKTAHFIVDLNEKFLNDHNKTFISDYYKTRNCKESVHEFELETVCYSGVWLGVKKRYAQLLMWKDGKFYDSENLPLKAKGLEIVKGSYPKIARNILKDAVRLILNTEDFDSIPHVLNKYIQKTKQDFYERTLDEITPSISINNYNKYVICDDSPDTLNFALKTPASVKGLALYNALRKFHNLPGEPSTGGKHRWYIVHQLGNYSKNTGDLYFCYQPSALPEWAQQYAPCDRKKMFDRMVIDPLNRILQAISLPKLCTSGEIQFGLF